MPFVKPIDLPNKRIRCRSGYDGHEPREILRASRRLSEDEARFAVVIGSDCSPTLRAPYTNKGVLALVQRSIAENGLHVILEDIFCPGTDMPEEQPGTLSEEEEYLLVDDAETIAGRLTLWMYSWSWGGSFYGEFDLVVDMVIPKAMCDGLRCSLTRAAEAQAVKVENFGAAAERPEHFEGRGILRWLLGYGKRRDP